MPKRTLRCALEDVADWQALANPFGWGAYVVVCAFSARGHQIQFSAHR